MTIINTKAQVNRFDLTFLLDKKKFLDLCQWLIDEKYDCLVSVAGWRFENWIDSNNTIWRPSVYWLGQRDFDLSFSFRPTRNVTIRFNNIDDAMLCKLTV